MPTPMTDVYRRFGSDRRGTTAVLFAIALPMLMLCVGVAVDMGRWHQSYFQACNRIAHLYFLNEKLNVPTWLVWLFVTDAPEWPKGCAKPDVWLKHFAKVLSAIGLPLTHCLQDRIIVVHASPAPKEQ